MTINPIPDGFRDWRGVARGCFVVVHLGISHASGCEYNASQQDAEGGGGLLVPNQHPARRLRRLRGSVQPGIGHVVEGLAQ